MTVRVANTITRRTTVWYRAPLTGAVHAFRGMRAVCGIGWWTAAWGIVGSIETVDRGQACGSCIALTGGTEAELRAMAGDR